MWNVLGRAGITRDAERRELMQDVYLVAHLTLQKRDVAIPEAAWISAITWNVARDYRALKRVQKEQPVLEPDDVSEPVAEGASPEDIVSQRRAYRAAVGGLSFEDRVVLEMHEIEGYEVPEIARALAIPEGTARTRLRRAREDVSAAGSRMQAREAHALRRTVMLLPLGIGAWREVLRWFDDAPDGLEDEAWSGVARAIARHAATSSLLGVGAGIGVAVAGKTMAVAGALFGGSVVGGAALVLHLVSKEPSLDIGRAVDSAPIVVTQPSPAGSVEVVASASAAVSSDAAPAVPSVVAASVRPAGIDPEELRLYQQALAAVRAGDLDAATGALDELARRFPRGALAGDRERMRAGVAKARTARAADTAAGGSRRLFGSDE
ncbi:RNA polymerase sigma factor RpoE [Minicystis rosea]|nr:RNA polymerase sigma factor RpoE [Minicystis rosea]